MQRKHFYSRYFIVFILIFLFAGCQTAQPRPEVLKTHSEAVYWKTERDYIGALAAYAVVYKGWQTDNARGYNIGSVLLDNILSIAANEKNVI